MATNQFTTLFWGIMCILLKSPIATPPLTDAATAPASPTPITRNWANAKIERLRRNYHAQRLSFFRVSASHSVPA